MSNTNQTPNACDEASIAIIGMSLRFPEANTPEAYWQNLVDEKESITQYEVDYLAANGVQKAVLDKPNYVKARAQLDNIELFDAEFFGLSAREAELMDPQLRLLLECAHEGFERAGYVAQEYPGPVGVFVGQDVSLYFLNHLLPGLKEKTPQEALQLLYSNSNASTLISYKLNLTGPSLNVNTACSTSLAAIHVACQSLLNYESDMAVAGGAAIVPTPEGYLYQEGSILSKDGHCRAFDASADGTVPGSGVGLVVLKRLDDALADGDTIHAVIRGSAINNDGSGKVGYAAPGVRGQRAVIESALIAANVEAHEVSFIECHGTGTQLGDPIELSALIRAYQPQSRCYLGSVKTNIGHLSAAAGVAGLIKTVLALKHKKIPATLHFKQLNPGINLNESLFNINTTLCDWETPNASRIAGVSSFGIGGSNVHLIVEEAPQVKPILTKESHHLLLLSAKTAESLTKAKEQLKHYLASNQDLCLADVAYVLQVGRDSYAHRWAMVCQTVREAIVGLQSESFLENHDTKANALTDFAKSWLSDKRLRANNYYLNEQRQRIPLPTYAFDKKPYWVDKFIEKDYLTSKQNTYQRPANLTINYQEPSSELAKSLALEWTEVLGVSPIGMHDNFFELNGDSLNLSQLASRIVDKFHIKLPITTLFENPTLASMGQAISLELQHQGGMKLCHEVSKQKSQDFPLSLAQQRLWFLEQLEGPSGTYNMPCAMALNGKLDKKALQAALVAIVRRHDVLRTVFKKSPQGVLQVINESFDVSIEVIKTTEEALEDLLRTKSLVPFDLEQGPLFRVCLYELTNTQHILLINMHHIITDGWSQRVFAKEFAAFYEAEVLNLAYPLPPLKRQYAQYALEQQKVGLSSSQAYWQSRLANPPLPLEFPTDRTRPSIQTYNGASVDFVLPKSLVQQLSSRAKEEKTTLFMLVFAAFNVLIYRYTGREDILIGSPIAGRQQLDLESLIGFFVNTLVIRTQLQGDTPFNELLESVKKTLLEAMHHQELPFDKLVEALQPERSLSHTPLFQIEFAWQNAFDMSLKLPDLDAKLYPLQSAVAKFDMTFYMQETKDCVLGLVEYNVDLFDKSTLERLIANFITLLTSIVAKPCEKIAALPLVSDKERDQLLHLWNIPKYSYECKEFAHTLFEKQVAKTPNAKACVHKDKVLTYLKLEQRANKLSHALRAQGVDRDERVVLYMPRGIEMLVSILAVLKAGGAFIPLNPDSSLSRNSDILNHAQPKVTLCFAEFKETVQNALPSTFVLVYAEDDFENFSDTPPKIEQALCDLACFFYTSGSTGKPKGVMVEHIGMVNHLLAKNIDLGITDKDRLAQMAVQTFDVIAWQFLSALIVGGTTVILTEEEAWEPKHLLPALIRDEVSILESVPSHTQILLDELERQPGHYALDKVRCYVSNGEAMPGNQSKRWYALLPHVVLVNTYGSTECSDDISHYHVCPMRSFESSYVTTQGVLPNMQLYILDCLLQPVPIGVVGEVHVGGIGVGRGYFRDEVRTKASFLKNPFSTEEGARLYRTGDLARFHANGEMEFIGRVDFQVKIRGFRVEVGEVEAALSRHVQLKQALIVPWKDNQGVSHLIAYVVPKAHPAPRVEELSQFCLSKLPYYMVPSVFILLEAFPLSENGKIDRKQLPPPNAHSLSEPDNYVAPGTDTEEAIASLWAKALGLEKVGVRDNFFQIGGHSLAAVDLVESMKLTLNKDIAIKQLFDAPTIESLLEAVE